MPWEPGAGDATLRTPAPESNPWQGVGALPLGILFAWLRLRAGSVWPCVLGHACANGLYLIILGPYELAGGDVDALLAEESSPWPWDLALGTVLATVGVWLLKKQFGRKEPIATADARR